MAKENKSLFDRAIDALTDRDEREAAAAQAKSEAEARAKAATEESAAQKAAVEKVAAEKAAAAQEAAQKAAVEKAAAIREADQKAAAEKIAAAPKKGVVRVRSLRIRADHRTASEVVAGLVDGDEVTILGTWSDGKNTWAKLEKGWAAMVYDGETYIQLT